MFEKKTAAQTCELLKSDQSRGLTAQEAERRQEQEGPNALRGVRKKTLPESFLEQLNDPLIYVLLAAAAVSLLLHEVSDAVIILAVVCLNAFVGVMQEGKAQRALDSLKELTRPKARVIRDGTEREISARELVCGDLVCLEAGCQVPADLRLVETEGLQIEESTLTGEALPVQKDAKWLAGDGGRTGGPAQENGGIRTGQLAQENGGIRTGRPAQENVGRPKQDSQESGVPAAGAEIPLGDRKNMAYMSTIVTGGRGRGMVTAIGMKTEIGRIASMMNESAEEMTPLQKKLGELGKMLSFLSLGICAALFLIAVIQKRNIFDMLLTAISLAVAAVPEGLPAVVTLCLALSVTRMAKANTIIRRLPSVETLGAVSVVCSDKTGTLTQNRMTVKRCLVDLRLCEADAMEIGAAREFLNAMTLCNDGIAAEERIGDPTELALLDLAGRYGIARKKLEETLPRRGEIAFDSDRKMMSTFHRGAGRTVTYTKGAPDRVLQNCSSLLFQGKRVPMTREHKRRIEAAVKDMSSMALRTLAVACHEGGEAPTERALTFLGLVGMEDPVRPEAAEAVRTFREAGVLTVMITGDHVETAYAVGRQLGIAESMGQCVTGEELSGMSAEQLRERLPQIRVFARVSPANKVQIVKGFQENGNIVAMTGDGVNDAPSLKSADVGIAMGKNGTDVARQASDMILTDDNFATIEKAIEEGRGVYENIRKSVIFLLSSNLGEIMTMFAAVLCGIASPLKSGHILWINLITDSLPALALGVDQNDGKSLMGRPPRKPQESLFAGGGLSKTLFYGLLIAGISLTAFFSVPWRILHAGGAEFSLEQIVLLLNREEVLRRSQTYAFTVLGMSQLFHAVGMRDVHRSVFRMNPLENRMMILACAAGFALQYAVTRLPFLVGAFKTARLDQGEWLFLTGLAAFPLLAHELLVLLSGDWRLWQAPGREDGQGVGIDAPG